MPEKKKLSLADALIEAKKEIKASRIRKAQNLYVAISEYLDKRSLANNQKLQSELSEVKRLIVNSYKETYKLPPDTISPASLEAAYKLFYSGELDKSYAVCEIILLSDPHSIECLNLLGATNCRLQKFEDAISIFTRAIAIQPDHAESCFNLASVLDKLGRFSEAERYCRKAIELNPNFVEAYYILGSCLNSRNKYNESMTAYKKSLSLNSNYKPSLIGLSDLHLKLGEWKVGLSIKKRVEGVIRFESDGTLCLIRGETK